MNSIHRLESCSPFNVQVSVFFWSIKIQFFKVFFSFFSLSLFVCLLNLNISCNLEALINIRQQTVISNDLNGMFSFCLRNQLLFDYFFFFVFTSLIVATVFFFSSCRLNRFYARFNFIINVWFVWGNKNRSDSHSSF